MKKIVLSLVESMILGLALTACAPAQPTPVRQTPPAPSPEPLPALQPIMVDNADRVRLLKTMPIPGYRRGQTSQCSVAFSPDGRLLVGACGRNSVPVWEVQSGLARHLLYENPQQIVACAFNPEGNIVACGGFDRAITFWNPVTGEEIRKFGSHASPVWDIVFGSDGRELVSCGLSGDVRLWDVGRGDMTWNNEGEKGYLSVSFGPSGKTVAYGSRQGNAGVLDATDGRSIAELIGLDNPVGDVTFSPSGRLLAAGTDDNTIYLWNTDRYQRVAMLEGHSHYVNGVGFSPDETLLVSGSHDKTIGIWDIVGQRRLKTLNGHEDVVLRVAFSPDGTLIASISWDGTVRLWGVARE
jgi:WD40 repeat protein